MLLVAPFVIRVPGLAPRRSTLPVGHIDILPTLVNLAGGRATSEMMGISLVPALAGARAELLLAPRATPHVWAVTPELVVTVNGDLTRAELLRVTETLRRDG